MYLSMCLFIYIIMHIKIFIYAYRWYTYLVKGLLSFDPPSTLFLAKDIAATAQDEGRMPALCIASCTH